MDIVKDDAQQDVGERATAPPVPPRRDAEDARPGRLTRLLRAWSTGHGESASDRDPCTWMHRERPT